MPGDARDAVMLDLDRVTHLVCITPPFGVTLSSQGARHVQKVDVRNPCRKPPQPRRIVYNTLCKYYGQPGGCQRPYCRFRHDEPPLPTVFHYTSEHAGEPISPRGFYVPIRTVPHVKTEDARIYFGNMPPRHAEEIIRAIVEVHGKIELVDIRPSRLKNGRCSGFVHMTSIEAAKAAIVDINHTIIGDVQLYANLKSRGVRYKPLPGWNPTFWYIDTSGQHDKYAEAQHGAHQSQPPPPVEYNSSDTDDIPKSVLDLAFPDMAKLLLD